eukprot:396065-Heterocapsa_arctica.AAC.1
MVFFGYLDGSCSCGRPRHLDSPEAVRRSGEYPDGLCRAYAALVVKAWSDTLDVEWSQLSHFDR